MQKALIYCRVSSEKQRLEGKGLESQEYRCGQYAKQKGYEVVEVFRDSFSGGGDFMERPAMSKLLKYLDDHPTDKFIVIFDDLKRFARDTVFHWNLRSDLKAREATPECLNFNFEDTPEGEFIETIIAAQGQLERQQNKRQVYQKMKARLEKGYWTFHQPPGYRFAKDSLHGKLLVLVEPNASILKEGLELFAHGVLCSQSDFMNFLIKKDFKTQRGGKISSELVKKILTQVLYTGYVEYIPWEVPRRKGHHEALISLPAFEKIQERLKNEGKAKARKDVHEDFPLRGYVLCSECEGSLTASWSTGGGVNNHAYYRCKTKGCSRVGKSIRKDEMEPKLEERLKNMAPRSKTLELLKAISLDLWNKKISGIDSEKSKRENQLKSIERDQGSYTEKILSVSSAIVSRKLEEKVEELEEQKQKIIAQREGFECADFDFEEALERVFEFVKNPYQIWKDGGFDQKRLVLKLVFTRPLVYYRESGFGTAELSLPFKLSAESGQDQSVLVDFMQGSWNDFYQTVKEWSEVLKYHGYGFCSDTGSCRGLLLQTNTKGD